MHGRASLGLGQHVQRRALSIPEPGAIAISPGRRVFRRLTRPHRPWPIARLRPTHQAGGHGQAGAHRSLTVLPAGMDCRAEPEGGGDPKTTAGASYTVAVSISYCELHSKGRPTKTDQQVVDSPLGPFSLAGGTQLSGPGVSMRDVSGA